MNAAEKALEGWTAEQWWQGSARSPDRSRVCLLGRLSQVSYGEDLFYVRRAVYSVLADQYAFNGAGMGTWNDAPERTFEDIRTVLEKASAKLNEAI